MNKKLQNELVEEALRLGAAEAKVFQIEEIAFDSRALLKCLYGCEGGMHYCPEKRDASALLAYSDMVKKYHWGVILCTGDLKTGQDITLALESKAFLAGCYFAFGATECARCELCAYELNEPCSDKKAQRPPLYTLGIDVYKTARNMGWTLDVVQKEGDPVKNITAVFVE